MSWHLGQIGRGAVRVAGAPMTVAYGPVDHAYEVAASAEGPVGRGGRSRPIASFGLFHAITGAGKGLSSEKKTKKRLESGLTFYGSYSDYSENVATRRHTAPRTQDRPRYTNLRVERKRYDC